MRAWGWFIIPYSAVAFTYRSKKNTSAAGNRWRTLQILGIDFKRLCTGWSESSPSPFFKISMKYDGYESILHKNYGEMPHCTLHLPLKLSGFLIQCLLKYWHSCLFPFYSCENQHFPFYSFENQHFPFLIHLSKENPLSILWFTYCTPLPQYTSVLLKTERIGRNIGPEDRWFSTPLLPAISSISKAIIHEIVVLTFESIFRDLITLCGPHVYISPW